MNLKKVLCAFLFLLVCVTLIACNEPVGECSVDFIVNDEIYSSLSVSAGEKITLPTSPTDGSNTFLGWFYDKSGTQPFGVDDKIEKDIRLYAVFEAHTHSYQVAYVYQPTCTADGYTSYRCYCGDTYNGNTVSATGHSLSETVVDSTCSKLGYREYKCACGYLTRETIGLKPHSYESEIIEPTYDSRGFTLYTCLGCGDSYEDNFVPMLDHTHILVTGGISPSCTEWGVIVTSCELCSFNFTEKIEPTGHSYTERVFPPSMEAGGYSEHTCVSCNHTYRDSFTEPSNHEHNWSAALTAPSCTEMGYTTYSCAVCKFSYKDDYTEPKGHTYSESVVPPTETDGGFTEYSCDDCGHSYVSDFVEPHRHEYLPETIVDATCTEMGYTVYACTGCESVYRGDYQAEKGHSLSSMAVNPTCSEQGYTKYYCVYCPYSYDADYTATVEHSYALIEIVPSDCRNLGYNLFECENCEYEHKEIILTYGEHKYDKKVTEPTCSSSGYTDYKCKICGNEKTDDYQAPLGHSYDTRVISATCTEMGYTVYDCKACEYWYMDNYQEPFGHYVSGWGFNDEGHWRVCTFCNEYTEKHEEHYALNCECEYVAPVGTLWFWDYGDYYYYGECQLPESGTVDITIPSTYKGKPVHFSFQMITEGVRSLTVESGVVLLASGNVFGETKGLEEVYFYCDIFDDDGYSYVISGCKNLKKLVYPRGAELIRGLTGCKIEELYLPSTVKTVKSYLSDEYDTTEIGKLYFEGELSDWVDFDGTVEELLLCTEQLYINGELLENLVITDEISGLGQNIFKGCKSLKTIVFATDRPVTMGEGAFEGCVNLESVVFSSGVSEIGGFAFKGCSSLERVAFAEGLEKICYGAFKDCSSLISVILPDSLEEIDSQIFYGCDSLMCVYLPDIKTVTRVISSWQIGSYAIIDEKSTAALLFGDEMEGSAEANLIYAGVYLPYEDFKVESNASRELNAYFGATADDYFESGDFSFVRVGDEAHVIRYLGKSDSVILPESVTYGGQSLTVSQVRSYFLMGSAAKELHIPKTVYSVSSIIGTDTLENISVDSENEILVSVDGVLYTSTMKTLICYPSAKTGASYYIPDTVKSVKTHAFACPKYLEYVYLPSASAAEAEAFITQRNIVVGTDGCGNASGSQYGAVFVSGGDIFGTTLVYDGDFAYILGDSYAMLVFYKGTASEITVDAEITANEKKYSVIGVFGGAFYKNSAIESVTFESGVKIIGSYSNGWEQPDGYEHDEFCREYRDEEFANHFVFYGCSNLQKIILPDTVTHIYGLAKDCPNVEELELGRGLKYIHSGIVGNERLKKIVFPPSLLRMGEDTLAGCTAIEEIIIGTLGMTSHNENADMTIEPFAIRLERQVKKVVIGDQVKTYNAQNFSSPFGFVIDVLYVGAGTLDAVYDGVEELHFYGDIYEYVSKPIKTRAKHLYLASGLLSGTLSIDKELADGLSDGRLSANEDITHVILTEDETVVYAYQFRDCINLKELTVRGENVKIGGFSFIYVATLTVEGSIAEIEYLAFENLVKVYVDDIADWLNINYVKQQGVSIMADGADLYLLGEDTPCYQIVIPEAVTVIKSYTFTGLDFSKYSIVLHGGITVVEDCAFVDLTDYYDTDALSGLDTDGWYWAYSDDKDTLFAYEGDNLHRDMLTTRDLYWIKLY